MPPLIAACSMMVGALFGVVSEVFASLLAARVPAKAFSDRMRSPGLGTGFSVRSQKSARHEGTAICRVNWSLQGSTT
jgi:hypothetical protein